MQNLVSLAEQLHCDVQRDCPLSSLTTFQVGGPADLVVTAPDAEALSRLLRCCRSEAIPYLFLGNGSNVVAADEGFRGVVLKLSACSEQEIRRHGTSLTAPAGIPLKALCRFARDNGLSGLEFAYGIPGSVGGAVFMNAGAYGGEMKQVVTSVACLTQDGELRRLQADELDFGYRHSRLMQDHLIVTSAELQLKEDDSEQINERMQEFMRRRREKQPLEFPSAGSFFKRPTGYYAGALIQECGLKGYTVGGAQVSEKHAGFVVNKGGATCHDLRQLAREVRAAVEEKRGVTLETEVLFLPSGEENT